MSPRAPSGSRSRPHEPPGHDRDRGGTATAAAASTTAPAPARTGHRGVVASRKDQGRHGEESEERDRAGPPVQRSTQRRRRRQRRRLRARAVIKVKATGKGKNKKPATTKLGKPVTLASAVYNGSNNQVTLTPRGTLNLTKPEELIVNAALVTDTLGRADRRQRRRPAWR